MIEIHFIQMYINSVTNQDRILVLFMTWNCYEKLEHASRYISAIYTEFRSKFKENFIIKPILNVKVFGFTINCPGIFQSTWKTSKIKIKYNFYNFTFFYPISFF